MIHQQQLANLQMRLKINTMDKNTCKMCKFLEYDISSHDWVCCNEMSMYYADFVEPKFTCIDFDTKTTRIKGE